jgi:hypothetical protein
MYNRFVLKRSEDALPFVERKLVQPLSQRWIEGNPTAKLSNRTPFGGFREIFQSQIGKIYRFHGMVVSILILSSQNFFLTAQVEQSIKSEKKSDRSEFSSLAARFL